ncbi:hypothetical protein ACFE04_001739 [Oxalis oulophora]
MERQVDSLKIELAKVMDRLDKCIVSSSHNMTPTLDAASKVASLKGELAPMKSNFGEGGRDSKEKASLAFGEPCRRASFVVGVRAWHMVRLCKKAKLDMGGRAYNLVEQEGGQASWVSFTFSKPCRRPSLTWASLTFGGARRWPNLTWQASIGVLASFIFLCGRALKKESKIHNRRALKEGELDLLHERLSSSCAVLRMEKTNDGKIFPLSALHDHLSTSNTVDETVPIVRGQI